MKRQPELDIELAELIRETYFNEPAPEKSEVDEYTFVAYQLSGEEADRDPMRHLFFAHNQKHSIERNFLEEASKLLRLAIDTFALITAKYGPDRYPYLFDALIRLREVKTEFSRLDSLDAPLSDVAPIAKQSTPLTLYFGYYLKPEQKAYDKAVYEAICDFFRIVYLPYSSFRPVEPPGEDEGPVDEESESKVGAKLFANSKQIDGARQFGIPKPISDGLNRIIKSASRSQGIAQYRESGRKLRFVTAGGNEQQTSIEFDPVEISIKAAEGFADQLMKIKDAKILQTFCALWKYANNHDSYAFWSVPISEVMKIVLKGGEKTNYSVEDRRQFTEALNYLSALSISVQVRTQQTNKRGKKESILVEERGIRLLRIQAQYALKKAFQHLPERDLTDEHFDKTVISKFSGELLPGHNRRFTGRANIYSDELLQLDANKDRRAIVLGFILQTRFNQMPDKDKCVCMERGYLIEQCEYQKSDKAKPAVATKQLRNVLDKLQATGIISRYENLTNSNANEVRMYPPVKVGELAAS